MEGKMEYDDKIRDDFRQFRFGRVTTFPVVRRKTQAGVCMYVCIGDLKIKIADSQYAPSTYITCGYGGIEVDEPTKRYQRVKHHISFQFRYPVPSRVFAIRAESCMHVRPRNIRSWTTCGQLIVRMK
jgi:hypothetical protein